MPRGFATGADRNRVQGARRVPMRFAGTLLLVTVSILSGCGGYASYPSTVVTTELPPVDVPLHSSVRTESSGSDLRGSVEVSPAGVSVQASRVAMCTSVTSTVETVASPPTIAECGHPITAGDERVRLVGSSGIAYEGKTERDGRVLIPFRLIRNISDRKFQVTLADTIVGELDLSEQALEQYWDINLLWERSSCENPTTLSDCVPIENYIREFPGSRHLSDAQNLLIAAEPSLARLRDDAAFERAEASGCTRAEAEDACDGVKAYLEEQPEGRHVSEAKRALGQGSVRIQALVKKREASERRDQLRLRQLSARRAAEERREEERERRAAAAARKDPCRQVIGVQRGESYSCASLIRTVYSVASGDAALARGVLHDMIGRRCDRCL